MPENLQIFLGHLFPSKLKQLSFEQCIAQASMPRSVIAPILWYKVVCWSLSKIWLFNIIWPSGLFKQSAVSVNSTEENHVTNFIQWVADSVDHNIRTFTGKGQFHGMGIIAISSSKLKYDVIKGLKYNNKVDLTATLVKTTFYDGSIFNGLSKVKLTPIKNLTLWTIYAPEAKLNLLWHAEWGFFCSSPKLVWLYDACGTIHWYNLSGN